MYSLDINFLKDRQPVVIDRPTGPITPINQKILMYAGVAAGLLPLALVGGFWLFQQSQTGSLEKKLADLKAQNEQSNAKLQEIGKIKKEADEMTAQTKGLATVFDQLKPWSAMLQDVRDRLPTGMQLTCVAQTQPSTTDVTNCQTIQTASSSTSTATAGLPTTDTIVISGLTYDFSSINNFLLTLQQSPFFKPADTQLVISELKDYPAQWQQGQRDGITAGGSQVKAKKVVEFTIKTSLSDTPASKLLRELERKGALGLVTRIETLQQKGVLQNGLR
jgi:type IV pilus assembly protein PilN